MQAESVQKHSGAKSQAWRFYEPAAYPPPVYHSEVPATRATILHKQSSCKPENGNTAEVICCAYFREMAKRGGLAIAEGKRPLVWNRSL